MRGKRKKTLALAVVSALLMIMLYALTGCGTTQTGNTGAQQPAPPAQQQTGPTSTPQEQPASQAAQNTATEKTKPEKVPPILENATFEMGHYGWSPQEGKIVTEDNGNKYIEAGYTWGLFQFLQVKPGETYQIYCKVKQGTEPASPARMSIIFYDKDHKIMPESQSYIYMPGTEWGSFPKKVFTVPENALFTKLFLLSHGKGTVCFDNISVSQVAKEGQPAASGTTQ